MDPTQDTRTDLFLTPSYILETDSSDTIFYCFQCGERFNWKENFIAHQNSHRRERTHYHVDYSKEFYIDETNHLQQMEKPSISDFIFNLFSESGFKGGKKSHIFKSGKKASRDQLNAQIYKQIDSGYRCLICGKEFLCVSSLVFHLLSHNSDPTLKSNQYDSQFLKQDSLAGHINIPIQRKGHQCTICGKSYSTKQQRIIHERNHCQEQPFQCDECGRMFNNPSNFSRHLKLHKEDKNFHCDICGKGFLYQSNLIAHQTVHSKQNGHKCATCDKAYKHQSSLARYQKFQHGLTQ